MGFWDSKLQDMAPAPDLSGADGNAYRAHRRQFSASAIYSEPGPLPEQRAAVLAQARAARYIEGYDTANGLANYKSDRPSKWARGNESPEGYLARLRGAGLDKDAAWESLSDVDRQVVEAELAKLQGSEDRTVGEAHAELRTVLGDRETANGVQLQGRRGFNGGFGGEQSIDRLGGLDAGNVAGVRAPSTVEIAVRLRQTDQERMQVPQRVDVSGLRPSGDGLVVTQ